MRVAITVLVAVAALAGPIPALATCSSGSTGGGSSSPITEIPKAIVNPVLELVGLPPLGSSTTTSITNNTTTITNNVFTTAAQEETGQSATTAQLAAPTKSAGGGGGSGGGGIGGLGGGVSGGSSVGGSPINPSSESGVQMVAGGGTSSGGGSNAIVSDPITLASLSATTPSADVESFVMPSADPSSEPPLAPSIALATLAAPTGGTDDLMTFAMAPPKTALPASGDGFGFESPASGSAPHTSRYAGTTMLAALIGVGMLGASWAWRLL